MNNSDCTDRTNAFQQLMLRWERRQPVNAVHIVRLEASIHLVKEAAATALCELSEMVSQAGGRGSPVVADGFDAESEITVHRFSGDWRSVMEEVATAELNRPFGPHESPFRVIIAEGPDDGLLLMLAYRHAIADGRSVSVLLRQIVRRIADGASAATQESPLTICQESLGELVDEHFGRRTMREAVRSICRQLGTSLGTQRPPRTSRDPRIEFVIHRRPLTLEVVKQCARQADVSIHDLLLAATSEWAAQLSLENVTKRSTVRPAVATIVDLTQFSGTRDWGSAFGQYLSTYAVRPPISRESSFADILTEVARQTSLNKQQRTYRGSLAGLRFISFVYCRLGNNITDVLLRNLVPVIGTITNMNLAPTWSTGSGPPRVEQYYRATCPTPFSPMIVGLTTLNDECTLTISYRSAIYTDEQMRDLMQHIDKRLSTTDSIPATAKTILTSRETTLLPPQ